MTKMKVMAKTPAACSRRYGCNKQQRKIVTDQEIAILRCNESGSCRQIQESRALENSSELTNISSFPTKRTCGLKNLTANNETVQVTSTTMEEICSVITHDSFLTSCQPFYFQDRRSLSTFALDAKLVLSPRLEDGLENKKRSHEAKSLVVVSTIFCTESKMGLSCHDTAVSAVSLDEALIEPYVRAS